MKTLLAILLLSLAFAAHADDKSPTPASVPQQVQTNQSDLQSDKHYVNKDGVAVHSPTTTKSGQAPAGATAKCRDGSFSFSTHHSGTCSHHGGVENWL